MKHLTDSEIQIWLDKSDRAVEAAVAAHLEICPDCRETAIQYKALYAGIAGTEIPELSPKFTDRVMAQLPREETEEEKTPASVPLFASVLILAGIAMMYKLVGFGFLNGLVESSMAEGGAFLGMFGKIFSQSLFGIRIDLIVSIGLILAAVAGIDYLIRHGKKRPISYMI